MEPRKNSEDWEAEYRAALWWNRFWLNVVATLLVIGALGLGFRFFSAKIQHDMWAVKAYPQGDGGVRVTNMRGPIVITHLQCRDPHYGLIVAPLLKQILVLDSGITDFSRTAIEQLDWRGESDFPMSAPSKGADIGVWYYRPAFSEPRKERD